MGEAAVASGIEQALQQAGNAFPALLGLLTFVTDIGTQVGWLVLPAAIVWLLLRRLYRLAGFAAAVALGTILLNGIAALLPPLFTFNGSGAGNSAAVMDGGSMGMLVTCGALLLIFMPVIPHSARGWAVAGTTGLILIVGIIRISADLVHLWPVIIGWVLGLAWLTAMAAVFNRWQRKAATPAERLWPAHTTATPEALVPAPTHDKPIPDGGRGLALALMVFVLTGAALVGAGFLITHVLAPVRQFDTAVVQWFASIRTDTLTWLATIFGGPGTSASVIGVLLVAAPVALALTRRWAPACFLLAAAIGETALYLAVGYIVGRPRPSVDHLTAGVPPTPSFPSGHVAASVVTYGANALLLLAWSQSKLRYAAVVLVPLIVIGVALSRVYWGLHYPTDTIASMIYSAVWLAVCWKLFKPDRGSSRHPERQQQPRHREART